VILDNFGQNAAYLSSVIKRGFDKILNPVQLPPPLPNDPPTDPCKANGKIKLKKAQNYQWDPFKFIYKFSLPEMEQLHNTGPLLKVHI